MPVRTLLAALAVVIGTMSPLRADDVPLLRISTENTADHVQTKAVARFAEDLARRAAGRLEVRHYHSAELFRDRDVIKALQQGKVEMAVPGTWQLDRYEPNMGLFLLPMFYGRDAAVNYQLRDGPIGQELNLRLEEALGVKVVGRWIDLGFAHVYGVGRKIAGHADLSGMVVRVAGGEANLQRLRALGAEARIVPWPDLPSALERRSIDGILSTHETVASAKLWRNGVSSAFEDHEYFPQYVPIVSGGLWRSLPPDLRDLIRETWEQQVEASRRGAAEAQAEARAALLAHGVTIMTPSPAELAAARAGMMYGQDALVGQLGIDPHLARRVGALLEAER